MIKILGVGGLALLCLIPLGFIADLISERESTRDRALREVGDSWAKQQMLAGPILSIPFQYGGKENCISRAVFLPEELHISSDIDVEIRSRGIFETTVYRTRLQLSGFFSEDDILLPEFSADRFLWERAVLTIGITDARGIEDPPELMWAGRKLNFLPGPGTVGIVERGIHAPIPHAGAEDGKLPFTCEMTIRGSESLWFAPTAEITTASATSAWSAPSFVGAFLPSHRRLVSDGFEAQWQVSYLAREFPQSWDLRRTDEEELKQLLGSSYFGVRLLQPVDLYRKMLRSVKYGILFVGFSFFGFFLFETLADLRIHPIQYGSIGAALAVFYLLTLSLSEHLGFGFSFLIASAANVILITGYCRAFLAKTSNLIALALTLSGMYLFLYVLLQVEDFALLIGSLAVFLTLALFMNLTRSLDWYQLSQRKGGPPETMSPSEE